MHRRVLPDTVDDAILHLLDIRPILVAHNLVLRRAADLSIKLNHHLIDTLYHAVALETGATLVTSDDRYFAKARSEGGIVMLEDFKLPP